MQYDWKAQAIITNRAALEAEARRVDEREAEYRAGHEERLAKFLAQVPETIETDPEVEAAIAKRLAEIDGKHEKGQHRVFELPIKEGKYRYREGRNVVIYKGKQPQVDSGWGVNNLAWYDKNTGKNEKFTNLDIVGPYNPDLENVTPPKGYQFTGEFRAPKADEYAIPYNAEKGHNFSTAEW